MIAINGLVERFTVHLSQQEVVEFLRKIPCQAKSPFDFKTYGDGFVAVRSHLWAHIKSKVNIVCARISFKQHFQTVQNVNTLIFRSYVLAWHSTFRSPSLSPFCCHKIYCIER